MYPLEYKTKEYEHLYRKSILHAVKIHSKFQHDNDVPKESGLLKNNKFMENVQLIVVTKRLKQHKRGKNKRKK